MKDRIEISLEKNKNGMNVIMFYVHCDLGRLYLHSWDFSSGVYDYFKNGISSAQLYSHKYKGNKTLNKIVDRIPSYVKYAKQYALEERAYIMKMNTAEFNSSFENEKAA